MSAVGAPPLRWHGGGQVFDQVGIVVRDMDATLRYFTERLGIGPWRVYEHGPGLAKAIFNGKPAEWTVLVAFSPWDSRPQIELVQPVSGDSVHHRFLAKRGEGVQHYGLIPEDYDAAFRELKSRGVECVQEAAGYGVSRDGRNAYFDSRDELFGVMLELFSPPTTRPDPLAEWHVQ
jgi:methylmalonyl-CoA/ethylmalonyl-CoA epimerase